MLRANAVVKISASLLVGEILLLFAVFFAKSLSLDKLHRSADAFDTRFWSGTSLDKFYDETRVLAPHPLAAVFGAGMSEFQRQTSATGWSQDLSGPRDGMRRQMSITLRGELAELDETCAIWGALRTTGLSIGLFGTIVGIMTSVAAAASEPTGDVRGTLSGIAAALVPLALSVVTTGAATLMRDQIGKRLARYCSRLEIFVEEFLLIVSRYSKQP